MVNKKSKKPPFDLITLKACDWDRYQIEEKAKRYTRGNVSAWLRYAGRMHEPKPGERVRGKLR